MRVTQRWRCKPAAPESEVAVRLIHKCALNSPLMTVAMPHNAGILHVHSQNGVPTLWYEFDSEVKGTDHRTFAWVGTGNPFDGFNWAYMGTVHTDMFVWHVYEVDEQ